MTERIQHNLVQGTPEWHQFRLDHDGASEAAPMLGLSRNVTRSELLRIKHTGVAKEFSDFVQERILNHGHEVEALARPMAESILVDELYPATYSYGRLSASSDGLTMDGTTAWEHKQWAAELAASIKRGELPDEHQPQCQQIMLVTGAEQVLFMVSDGTTENCEHMFVRPDPAWQARIIAGWKQFNEDLSNYQHQEVIPAAIAAPTMQLPSLSIQVTGSIALVDNLKVFGERLEAFIEAIDKNPSDDQAFADAEAAIKTLGTAETALEAAKSSALAQTASIDEMTRTVALYAGQARQTRLMLEKLVKSRKESIRVEIVQGGRNALAAHITTLGKRLVKVQMPTISADFAGVIKGKKTIASLRDAVDTELARAKIEANEVADRIEINLNSLRELGKDHAFLFNDFAHLVTKANDDLVALIKVRISEHQQAEAKRLDAERERIRAEEQAKLLLEQQERDRAEASRIAKESATAQPPVTPHQSSPGPQVADSTNGAAPANASLGKMDSGDKAVPVVATPSDRSLGLYNKFHVQRIDGRDDIGEKHYGCDYFVLDITHDRHAIAALFAYADSCETEYPLLAKDVRAKAARNNIKEAA